MKRRSWASSGCPHPMQNGCPAVSASTTWPSLQVDRSAAHLQPAQSRTWGVWYPRPERPTRSIAGDDASANWTEPPTMSTRALGYGLPTSDVVLARVVRANARWGMGQLDAVADATAAIDLEPEDTGMLAWAHSTRGGAYTEMGR